MNDVVARLLTGELTRPLKVRQNPGQRGMLVSRRLLEEGLLTTLHYETFEQCLFNTTEHELTLTARNPFLNQEVKALLDDSGLMRIGCMCVPGLVLASVVRTPHLSPDLRNLPAAQDYSLIPPDCWCGATVASAAYRDRQQIASPETPYQTGKIEVAVQLSIPLAVGDVLILRDIAVTVAGVVDTADADILLDSYTSDRIGLPLNDTVIVPIAVHSIPARFRIRSRSTGPYSIITEQPLGGKSARAGQSIQPQHVHVLRTAGLSATLLELVTLKSDDLANRDALQQALRGEASFPHPGEPESLHILRCYLSALGFASTILPIKHGRALKLNPMSDHDRLAISSGLVTQSETIDSQTFQTVEAGLFCEKIFGELESERRSRFGHVELTDPVVPYIFRMQSSDDRPSLLATLLDITDVQLAALMGHQLRITDCGDLVASKYGDLSPLTGAYAVEHLLSVQPETSSVKCSFVHRRVLVTPPDLRPLIPLESGNSATSDLNDHYRRLIRHTTRLQKLRQLNAPEQILLGERLQLQRAADCLFANTLLPASDRITQERGKPLRDLIDMLTLVAGPNIRKKLDYSARARAVVRQDLPRNTVLVPHSIVETLGIPNAGPVLLTRDLRSRDEPAAFVVLRAQPHDDFAIVLPPSQFDALFNSVDSIDECVITRPLSPAAVAEAEQHVGTTITAAPVPPSWVEDESAAQLALRFRDAAFGSGPVDLDSPGGILIAGQSSP